MLADLGVKSALLLQGPAGPFMRRFAEDLHAEGARVTKVNFHAGDVLFFPGPETVAYRGHRSEWSGFVTDLMRARAIDALFVFGDCRPLHRLAIAAARELGVAVYAFEEGYLRPEWFTLEAHGVNGNSRMSRDPDFYRALDLPELPDPEPVGQRFHLMSWYSTFNALAYTLLNQGFPHYEHHRNLNSWYQMFVWLRNVARKRIYEARERDIFPRLTEELAGRFFFVPLQVHCDSQLRHSPYDDLMDFVREVAETFAEHADPADSIVFKHHPMDRAYRDYSDYFTALADELGLGQRLVYCHDLHLPSLLKVAKGTVTINSTVGLSSIHHGTPVKVMGTAVYDMPGLTSQRSLEEFFFAEAEEPDPELYRAFRRYLLHVNQVNGSFYKRLPGRVEGVGAVWPRLDSPTPARPAMRL